MNLANGTWELRLGDCLDPVTGLASLPDKSVDHVVVDPPYEEEAHTEQRRTKVAGWRQAKARGEADKVAQAAPLSFAAITPEQRAEVSRQLGRVVRGWAIVFCQVEAVSDWRRDLNAGGLKYRRTMPWVKPDAMPSLHGRWPGQAFESIVQAGGTDEAWEAILLAGARGAKCPGGGKSHWFLYPRAQTGVHETAKPLRLMRDLVEIVARPGDLVLDCYAGSCTTGIAAMMHGCRFLGWEISPKAHAIAERRLRGERAILNPAQPELFGRSA